MKNSEDKQTNKQKIFLSRLLQPELKKAILILLISFSTFTFMVLNKFKWCINVLVMIQLYLHNITEHKRIIYRCVVWILPKNQVCVHSQLNGVIILSEVWTLIWHIWTFNCLFHVLISAFNIILTISYNCFT